MTLLNERMGGLFHRMNLIHDNVEPPYIKPSCASATDFPLMG
jgi:hypothetical protein